MINYESRNELMETLNSLREQMDNIQETIDIIEDQLDVEFDECEYNEADLEENEIDMDFIPLINYETEEVIGVIVVQDCECGEHKVITKVFTDGSKEACEIANEIICDIEDIN